MVYFRVGEMGFTSMTVPEEYGGLEMGYLKYMIVAEENSRVAAGVGMSTGITI